MNLRWGNRLSAASTGASSRQSMLWFGIGALVLGVMLARWSWLLFAPHAATVAVSPEHEAAAETGRLFGMAAVTALPAQSVALPNVQLLGVFAARAGKPGFAVLKLDGKRQLGVAVGEGVVAGTKLLEVHADYVLLERAGAQQRVNLAEKKAAVATAVGAAPAVR